PPSMSASSRTRSASRSPTRGSFTRHSKRWKPTPPIPLTSETCCAPTSRERVASGWRQSGFALSTMIRASNPRRISSPTPTPSYRRSSNAHSADPSAAIQLPPLQLTRQRLISLRVALPHHHAVQVHREAVEEPALLDCDVDDLLAVLALDRVLHRALDLIGSPERDDVQDQHPGCVAFGVAELLILRGAQLEL